MGLVWGFSGIVGFGWGGCFGLGVFFWWGKRGMRVRVRMFRGRRGRRGRRL